tara:strand:- start:11452 stop:12084 length:633 start_codon:yes stop_codon:yes gene_type:complete
MYSQRRYYIDKFFLQYTKELKGTILDIGGKKIDKRGKFKPNQYLTIFYLNNDKKSNPDYFLDANSFKIKEQKFDYFFLSEVLEHLEDPSLSIQSAHSILKENGIGFISMPFMYRKHPDPIDMQRWTDTKILKIFEENKFIVQTIKPMGGLFCVINDFWMFSAINSKKNILGYINKFFFKILSPLLKYIDCKTNYLDKFITSGWFIIVKKK